MKIKITICGEEKEITLEEALELKRQLSFLAEPQQIWIPFVQQPPYLQPPYIITCSDNTEDWYSFDDDGSQIIFGKFNANRPLP